MLVVGPGGEADLASRRSRLAGWLRRGGRTLAIGLDGEEARRFLPMKLATTRGEHIAAYFPPPAATSLLAGVAPADVHCRQPRKIPLVTAGAKPVGNGALAAAEDRGVVFYQLVPWRLEPAKHAHERRTFRRASSLLTRLLANLGADSRTPLFERFAAPVRDGERRWLEGLYLDEPVEWDDPYRFFRW